MQLFPARSPLLHRLHRLLQLAHSLSRPPLHLALHVRSVLGPVYNSRIRLPQPIQFPPRRHPVVHRIYGIVFRFLRGDLELHRPSAEAQPPWRRVRPDTSSFAFSYLAYTHQCRWRGRQLKTAGLTTPPAPARLGRRDSTSTPAVAAGRWHLWSLAETSARPLLRGTAVGRAIWDPRCEYRPVESVLRSRGQMGATMLEAWWMVWLENVQSDRRPTMADLFSLDLCTDLLRSGVLSTPCDFEAAAEILVLL